MGFCFTFAVCQVHIKSLTPNGTILKMVLNSDPQGLGSTAASGGLAVAVGLTPGWPWNGRRRAREASADEVVIAAGMAPGEAARLAQGDALQDLGGEAVARGKARNPSLQPAIKPQLIRQRTRFPRAAQCRSEFKGGRVGLGCCGPAPVARRLASPSSVGSAPAVWASKAARHQLTDGGSREHGLHQGPRDASRFLQCG